MAAFAAQAFDAALLAHEIAVAGGAQAAGCAAQQLGHVGDFLAPGMGVDGAAEFVEGAGLDGDVVLDGFVGMLGVIEIHGMLGGEDPMHGGDAAVGGAEGDAPVAQGSGEGGGSAAGDASGELALVGEDGWSDALPSL
jgi:hypothetical protein